jgi:hypothetical protein
MLLARQPACPATDPIPKYRQVEIRLKDQKLMADADCLAVTTIFGHRPGSTTG